MDAVNMSGTISSIIGELTGLTFLCVARAILVVADRVCTGPWRTTRCAALCPPKSAA